MFQEEESLFSVCYKNALSEQVFGKWMHFVIGLSLWELQVIRNWLCVRDIGETSLNRFVTVAYLKKQPPELFRRKRCSKNFHREAFVLESLFNKIADLRVCNAGVFQQILRNILEQLFLRTPVSSPNFIYNAWKGYN